MRTSDAASGRPDPAFLSHAACSISDPEVIDSRTPHSNQTQEGWELRLIALQLTRQMPMVRTSRDLLIPSAPEEDQFIRGACLITVVAFLDHALDAYIAAQPNLRDSGNLRSRIRAVEGRISNGADLQRWRERRNLASHEPRPSNLEWSDIDECTADIETAMLELNIIDTPTPPLVPFSHWAEPLLVSDESVYARQTINLQVCANNTRPVTTLVEYIWTLEWYVGDPPVKARR